MAKRLSVIFLMCAVLMGAEAPTAWSDEIGTLKSEIEALKQGQKAMQKDLNDIKTLLKGLTARRGRAQQPFKPADITIGDSPVMGQADAPVTMVEFTDYQCPFCRRYSNGTFPQIIKDYVKTGKVRYVVRQFPLKAIHPKAVKASEASLCAGDQGKYWEMHDRIFQKTKAFNQEEWVRHAAALGLDMGSFKDCLGNGKNASRVEQDLKEGTALGMRGTPGFFFGRTDPDDPNKFKAVQMIRGAFPYPQFKQIIDKLLKPS
ncbi:MAG: DsbA family protein [Nitrospinaceae bacterium]